MAAPHEKHRDRLTNRTSVEIGLLMGKDAGELTFNELVALAGIRLAQKSAMIGQQASPDVTMSVDAGRDLSLAHTALEDAATRYNSACYRLGGTWKRADPDWEES